MKSWREVVASALPIVAGALLVSLGHAQDGGSNLLAMGGGILVGLLLGRRTSARDSDRPGASVVLAAACLTAAYASGCGASQRPSPCDVARAAVNEARRVVDDACPLDGGAP